MKFSKYFLLLGIPMMMITCKVTKSSDEATSIVKDAQNKIDWQGTYFGILPCASCAGIETEITLDKNGTFSMKKNYIGKDIQPDTLSGDFVWGPDQKTIVLNIQIPGFGDTLFAVRKNALIQLDKTGNIITGDLADLYVLTKTGNQDIEDKRWQLIEIFNKPITGTPESDYMVFHSKNKTIIAKAHCNTLRFTYKIREGNSFHAIAGPSTKMACGDNIEEEFLRVLGVSDRIYLEGDILHLSKGQTVLGKFILAP